MNHKIFRNKSQMHLILSPFNRCFLIRGSFLRMGLMSVISAILFISRTWTRESSLTERQRPRQTQRKLAQREAEATTDPLSLNQAPVTSEPCIGRGYVCKCVAWGGLELGYRVVQRRRRVKTNQSILPHIWSVRKLAFLGHKLMYSQRNQ